MALDPDNPVEPTNGYTLVGISHEDMIDLAAGLANWEVRAMARLALSEWETLKRNSEKPDSRTSRRAEDAAPSPAAGGRSRSMR
jgi:hypothetical protein